MTLRALIVDDELHCRENLKMLIDEFCPEVKVLALAESAESARNLIQEHSPEVVFLDVMMPNEDGFKLLKSLPNRDFNVVFTTAHNEFAVKAIKESAVDYLEKPINIDDLMAACTKLKETFASAKSGQTNQLDIEQVNQLIQSALSPNASKISVPTSDGLILIDTKDIVHLEASESYTTIYLSSGKRIVSSKTIKVYEENLPKAEFYRVHKSHIINVSFHLKEFSRSEGNMAIMSNGTHVPVSRRKVSEFVDHISTF